MEVRKKFGAFSGVFTPSILTILGVIMYMRLGWVVGQAGLLAALGIILVAHIVSITTGLSISSIATDKKVEKGGIYYMLSRSLGLPMGGAIGIALFTGTALAISLYIVGFAESFLGIEAIRNFFGLGTTLNDIRIVGSAMLLLLTVLGLVSTSVVIRTQYFILGAIGLSLLSIFVGFFWFPSSSPGQIVLFPVSGVPSLMAVFAVFFPAVTGFTAGVAMSGDLRDPRRDIPRGTLWAILTGLVVYVSLTLAMAFFVPRDTLLNDTNFLMHTAWVGGLVVAGIWGATLSSALGGILGGPRILQAIALDKILPRFLSHLHGKNQEPRVALLFTFLIAQGGILLGDLNVIAGVVTMFYLTSYGFINLAYALEGWASTDFRPSFRIPNWVGISGFIITFAVMFQLNPVAMVVALVLMTAVYVLLKRRELQLQPGDVWQSVWSAMIRSSLGKMNRKKLEDRNWRPNIILFSGPEKHRSHLLEFGKALVGKHGLLSNFMLYETDNKEDCIIPKHLQSQAKGNNQQDEEGIFTRHQKCSNVYEGITNVANNYGFSGIDPNTVFMGWGRQTRHPAQFMQMIKSLHTLDMNMLLMDYDRERGFGNYKQIDIWWRGAGRNSNLSVQLVKFLWLSEKWKNASLRLMIINPENQQRQKILRETRLLLDSLRIEAEIRVINNEIEQKPLYDIIRVESLNSDLIFLGLPFIKEGHATDYIDNINTLCKNVGTVVLVRASSQISPLEIRASISSLETTGMSNLVAGIVRQHPDVPALKMPENSLLATALGKTRDSQMEAIGNMYRQMPVKILETQVATLEGFRKTLHETVRKVTSIPHDHSSYEKSKRLLKIKQNMLTDLGQQLIEVREKSLEEQRKVLEVSMTEYLQAAEKAMVESPAKISISLEARDLSIHPKDPWGLKAQKMHRKLTSKIGLLKPQYTIPYKELLQEQFPLTNHMVLNVMLEDLGRITAQFAVESQKTIEKLYASFEGLISKEEQSTRSNEQLRRQLLKDALESIRNLTKAQKSSVESLLPQAQKRCIQALEQAVEKMKPFKCHKGNKKSLHQNNRRLKKTFRWLAGIPQKWHKNQILLLNAAILDTWLKNFSTRIQIIFKDISQETEAKLVKRVGERQKEVLQQIEKLHQGKRLEGKFVDLEPDTAYHTFFRAVLDSATKRIRLGTRIFPAHIMLMSEESFNDFDSRQYSDIETVRLSTHHFLDYLVQNQLIAPLQGLTRQLPEDISRHNRSIQELVRILDYRLDEESTRDQEGRSALIYKHYQNIGEIVEKTRMMQNEALLQMQQQVNQFTGNLEYAVFRHKALHSRQYMRSLDKDRSADRIRVWLRHLRHGFVLQFTRLLYRRSRGLLLARRFHQEQPVQNHAGRILTMIEATGGSGEVIHNLPFYYRQLFLRRQNYLNDFWVGRHSQLEQAHQAIKRYQTGHQGSILIHGERYSGKSFLAQYIVNKFLYQSNLFIVTPPHHGSSSHTTFKQALITATERSGDYDTIFDSLPDNAVMLFEDIDLWWERSPGGLELIELILKLSRRHSARCLFIMTIDTYCFSLINKMKDIHHRFISHLWCEPMDAGALHQAIMLRHRTGNMSYRLGKRMEHQVPLWEQGKLFSRHFSSSRGNIGVALRSWISHITQFNNGTITIDKPRMPDLTLLEGLDNYWHITLIQIVLHRRVNAEKLSRLMQIPEEEAVRRLETLSLAKLITENGKEIYEINPVIYPHLTTKLNEMKFI